MLRAGIDVGGTFTDLMLVDDESKTAWVHKVPSTPTDPSKATMSGLRELCEIAAIDPARLDQLFHGTTVATNIVLERSGSKTGMITTKGFRDIIYIGRHRRPKTFSIYQDLPWREPTLVERRHRLPVTERIGPPGEVITPLDEAEVRAAVRELKQAEVEAVCVCFLFSFLDPRHEQRAKEILAEEFPEAHASISHEVVPQHREYERFTTTALNAYIGPKTSSYLRRMDSALGEVAPDADFHLMTLERGHGHRRRRRGGPGLAAHVRTCGGPGRRHRGCPVGGLRVGGHARCGRHLGGHRGRPRRTDANEAPLRHQRRRL